MALYVRLQASFYTHRKTAKLRDLIGEDALWLVPRLWCYACINQPNGDFSNYSPNEIAFLLGYDKDGDGMLKSLQAAGFMDGKKIHDWEEHNSYHATFSKRATTAANARWEKTKEKKEKKPKTWFKNASGIELPFPDPRFSTAWKEWLTHRSEINEPVTPLSVKKTINRLKEMGLTRALAAIDLSIQNGWRGIYEERSKGGALVPSPKKMPEPADWKDFLKANPKYAETDPEWSRAIGYVKTDFFAWRQR